MVSCVPVCAALGVLAARLADPAAAAPAFVWLAAAAPALLWVCVLCLLTRPRAADAAVLAGALIAGAVFAAWPVSHVNQVLFDALAGVAGDAGARRIVPGAVVPVVEEVAKAGAIALLVVVRPRCVATIGGGAVVGAVVGLGFTATENVQYLTLATIQGGTAGLWRATYVRGLLGGLHHATFAAATGVGLAYARRLSGLGRRWLAAVFGLLAAVAQHVLWNICGATALTDVLCGAVRPGAPCAASPDPVALFVVAPLISLVFVGPALAALCVIVSRLAKRGLKR